MAKIPVHLKGRVASIMQVAVKTALNDMFNVAVRCAPYMAGKGPFVQKPYVAGILQMSQSSEPFGAFVMVVHPEVVKWILTACNIDPSSGSSVVNDAIEELTNVTYGEVRRALNKIGYSFEMKLPETICRESRFFDESLDKEKIVLPFDAKGYPCHAAIIMAN